MSILLASLFVSTTVEFVVMVGGKIVRRWSATKGDLGKYFPTKDGRPIIGDNVYAMKTVKAIKAEFRLESDNAARRFRDANLQHCLIRLAPIKVPAGDTPKAA